MRPRGLLFGAASGAWLARKGRLPSPAEHRTVACLVLALAFVANSVVAWPLTRSEMVALVMTPALATVFFAALGSERWRRRLAF